MRKKTLKHTIFLRWRATTVLIALNIIFFILFSILFAVIPNSHLYILLSAKQILQGEVWWTLMTSMFMHSGLFHLFVNMFSLFFLGNFCEQLLGRKRFLWLYLISGVFAGMFFVFGAAFGSQFSWGARVFGGIDVFATGASGALFGLLGALAMLIPRYKVYLIIGPIIVFVVLTMTDSLFPSPFNFLLGILLNILLFLMVFSLFFPSLILRKISLPLSLPLWLAPIIAIVPLVIISFTIDLPIGNSAHLGGLIAGLLYGTYLRLKYPQKMLMLKRFFR